MRPLAHAVRSFAVAVLTAFLAAACGPATPTCPTAQQSVCRTEGDCRCGAPCSSQDDCTGLDACVFYEVTDSSGSHRSDTGVCVDALWVFNPPPPCVPLCHTNQLCVGWTDAPASCSNTCTTGSDCRSGCCVTLSDGSHACAPNGTYCMQTCEPPCDEMHTCVLVGRQASCLSHCTGDSDCGAGCCVALDSGDQSVCIDDRAYCPAPNPGPCTVLDRCGFAQTTFTATSDGAACGMHGTYQASLRNICQQSIECRGCWWDPATQSYSNCNYLGSIPSNRTVPIGTLQCADVAYPDPPVKFRCVDEYSYQSQYQCLGDAPL
jgi:hypothetical protein